ncbi:MAG: aldo/keto reductase [Acidimicrobiia bacterium]|nr:aldo/keto reductase [Acidimicrobiia bacterium]
MPVSQLCLGTMTFGLQCDEDTSRAIMDRAYERGITFFDTADAYPLGGDRATAGRTEEIVGRWLAGRREEVILATKANAPMSTRRWDRGNSRKHLVEACEASLRRLDTDHIDLYQLHADDPNTPLDETIRALDDLVTAGKVRYVGVSNWAAWRIALSLGISELERRVKFVSVQPRYNLLYRAIERELLPLCRAEHLAVIPYNPLAGGLLTGKHQRATTPTEGTRFTLGTAASRYQDRYWHDDEFEAVEALKAVAEDAGTPLTTLAVAWVLHQPDITSPIIGASRPDQLDAVLAASDLDLGRDLTEALETAARAFELTEATR